jgi:pyrrolysine biosynthesis protein PylD
MAVTATNLPAYDLALQRTVGTTLKGLACGAAGVDAGTFSRKAASTTAAVVPVTAGGGIITGFSEAVQRILSHIGLTAVVTAEADVAGLAEAYRRGCELIFLSDDNRFVAIRTRARAVVCNAEATGAGYAWGLNEMSGGVCGKPVLVMGCGPVGRSAAEKLERLGAVVSVHDADAGKARRLSLEAHRSRPFVVEDHPADALSCHTLIVDATPAAGIIQADHIGAATFISAPGVPIGLSAEARMKASGRVLHDLLEIGVATMAAMALGADSA